VVVMMGVSGSGKSSVARAVAAALDAAMLDGDFLHPRANVEKMARGEPLNDEDRRPWLDALNDAAFAMSRTHKLSLLVCSALKKRYRDRLRDGHPGMSFVFLKADHSLLESRLTARQGHFFKPEMLRSQFEALEEPGPDEPDVITVGVEAPLDEVVAAVIGLLRGSNPSIPQ
jgi:gluconokinase